MGQCGGGTLPPPPSRDGGGVDGMEGGADLYLDAADLHTLLRGGANYLRRKQVGHDPRQPACPASASAGVF